MFLLDVGDARDMKNRPSPSGQVNAVDLTVLVEILVVPENTLFILTRDDWITALTKQQ